MSAGLDPSNTYLVADTSVLIHALPMVRAIVESSQPYAVFIPYIVLMELDKGSTGAPVNRLLCRHMKQNNPRIIAQSVSGHRDVFVADGVSPKNDDLILGAALKLRDEGQMIILLTNDNNLSLKCCANGVTTWSSVDLMCRVQAAIPQMNRFIAKEIRELCPRVGQIFTFCTELFMCALKCRLKKQDQLTSISNAAIYRLIEQASKDGNVDKQLMVSCSNLIKEFRLTNRRLTCPDIQRFLRYVCAILEPMKRDKTIANILNVCKGIFSAMKSTPEAKSGHSLSSSIEDSKTKERFENMSTKQKKNVIKIVTKVDTNRRKKGGIKKNSSRRKASPVMENSDSEESSPDYHRNERPMSVTTAVSFLSTEQGPSSLLKRDDDHQKEMVCNSASVSPRCEPVSEMEVDSIANRPQQVFGPFIGDDITQQPVYRMLETVWKYLHNIAGTWASRCGTEYAWEPNLQNDLPLKLTSLKEFAEVLGRIDADYSRLLKLGNSVAPELLLEVSKRFKSNLSQVCAVNLSATPLEVIQFFQDDRTSQVLLNGQTQLRTFREVIVRCRNMEAQKVLKRLSEEQGPARQS